MIHILRPWAALFLVWAALSATHALATPIPETSPEDAESSEPEPIDQEFRQELVVTAGDPELPAITLFSGHEIERSGSEDLGYFLRRQAGLASVRRGPIGLDPQVRGLSGSQIGVFVDGTRTFAAGPARMDSDLSHVSPRAVERMQVVKGPYALAWGSGALSAIRLETFRPPFGRDELTLAGRVGAAYGSNAETVDGYAGVWGGGPRLRFQLMAQGRTGGDTRDGSGRRVPGDYESTDSRWSLGRRIGERGLLEYTGGYQEQRDIDYPGRLLDATYFYTRSHSLEMSWDLASERLESLSAQIYSNRKDHLMNNDEKPTARPSPGRVPPFALDVDLPAQSDTSGARVSVSGGRGDASWAVGVDALQVDQTARRLVSRRDSQVVLFDDLVWPDAEIENAGLWARGTWRDERMTAAATVRVDRSRSAAASASDFFKDNTEGRLDASDDALSAAFSSRIAAGPHWTIEAGVGRAVRFPSILERYSDRFPSSQFQIAAEFLGGPSIRPESAIELDLGASRASRRITLQLDTYYRVIDDYITVDPDPSIVRRLPLSPEQVYRYVNGEEARFVGGETRLTHRIDDKLQWHGSVSYIRGEDSGRDEPVFGLPPLTSTLGVRWTPGDRAWLELGLTMVDDQHRVATSRRELPSPGYAVVHLESSIEASRGWHISLALDNAGDRLYTHHLNSLDPFTGERIPESGLNFRSGVEYRF